MGKKNVVELQPQVEAMRPQCKEPKQTSLVVALLKAEVPVQVVPRQLVSKGAVQASRATLNCFHPSAMGALSVSWLSLRSQANMAMQWRSAS